MNFKKTKNSITNFIKGHKVLSSVIAIVVIFGGYYTYGKIFSTSGQNSYIVMNAKIGSIVTTITGTGQVTASSQVDVKSKVSGDLVFLDTKDNGTQIKKGTLLAQVNTRDALINLESARIAYEKLVKPADASTEIQTKNALSDAIYNNQKSYDDALNSIASAFSNAPTTLSGLNDIVYGSSGYFRTWNNTNSSSVATDYQNKAGQSYDKAKASYDALSILYKDISRTSATSTVQSFTASTYSMIKDVSEAVKNTQNAVEFMRTQKKVDSIGDTAASNLANWTTNINSLLDNLSSSNTNLTSTAMTVQQKNADLIKLQTGPDSLDIASQQLDLQQKQNAYEDYFIRAPFDGLLARLSVKSTDTVSNGTVIGTIVSPQKMTTITLNEVDVEKVKVGQKAKLTFDAIDGLTMDGTVTTVDLVGTVTQGVVNYNVEISIDGQDDRIKSGMSVSATIITDTKENVLVVPNSAVKTAGKFNYVEVFATPLTVVRGTTGTPSAVPPTQKRVVIGASNDTLTEITSGIKEGDQVVVRTISAGTAKPAATTASLFGGSGTRGLGGTGGMGGTRPSGTGGATAGAVRSN